MRTKIIGLAVLLATGCIAMSSFAQEQAPVKNDTARFGNPTGVARTLQGYIYGVVKKVDNDAIILDKTEFGDDQPFKLEAKTKVVRDGKVGKLADLKTGEMVFVKMKKDKKTHEMIAERIVTGMTPTEAPSQPAARKAAL